jgi:hypothetical protein
VLLRHNVTLALLSVEDRIGYTENGKGAAIFEELDIYRESVSDTATHFLDFFLSCSQTVATWPIPISGLPTEAMGVFSGYRQESSLLLKKCR